MITTEQLKIYQKYSGDQDALSRCGTKNEKKILKDHDFRILGKFISDLSLVYQGIASEKFSLSLEQSLKEHCHDKEAIEEIKKLVIQSLVIKNVL